VIAVERSNITLDGNGHTIQGKPLLSTTSGGETTNVGIRLESRVQNVSVKGFSIKDCSTGIWLEYSSNIVISENNISGIWHPIMFNAISAAISIRDGDHNIITGNRFENNVVGIHLWENSNQNIVAGNTISGSTEVGIRLSESSSNTFYHNNFENKQDVYDVSLHPYSSASLSTNNWDNGKVGNYWSDYNGTDADGDGIGDTQHMLYSMNQDSYPLIKPWEPKILDTTPPSISITSPENITYTENSVFLNFSTNEPASRISYSLDGQDNVTVAGNATLNGLPNGSHHLTVYATDQSGNTGVSETVYFNVEVPFPVVPVAAASAATIAVAAVGLLVYFRKRKR
jgi:parallel beta-helix repeat protein